MAGKQKQGNDGIAATSRVLDQCIAKLNQTLRTICRPCNPIDTASREIALEAFQAPAISATSAGRRAARSPLHGKPQPMRRRGD